MHGAGSSHLPASQPLSRRRQTRSCDACRLRKSKCARPDTVSIVDGFASSPCTNCATWGVRCTFMEGSQKRGRRSLLLEKLAEKQQQRRDRGTSNTVTDNEDLSEARAGRLRATRIEELVTSMPTTTVLSSPRNVPEQVGESIVGRNAASPPSLHQRSSSPVNILFSQAGNNADPFRLAFPASANAISRASPSDRLFADLHPPQPSVRTEIGAFNPDDATGQSRDGNMALSTSVPASFMAFESAPSLLTPPTISPLDVSRLSTSHRVTCIEDILSRETAVTVIDLYFNHLYSIIPVVHRPSFMTDLEDCRDHRDRKFLALTLGMIATTLLYIPRPFFAGMGIDMSNGVVISDAQAPELSTSASSLSQRCSQACETILLEEINSPNVDTLSTKYLLFTIYDKRGLKNVQASIFGELQYLVIWMGYHLESTYASLNPIEAERRRRTWCLIRNADTFEAVLTDRPVSFRSDDFVNDTDSVELPKELDDECITAQGYLAPKGEVPLISGLNILSRVKIILGDILVAERVFRHRPPATPEQLTEALKEVRGLSYRLRAIIISLPGPFALIPPYVEGEGDFEWNGVGQLVLPDIVSDWQGHIIHEVNRLAQNSWRYAANQDGYMVLKADIHVTAAMTRLRLLSHRERLLELFGPVGHPSRKAAELLVVNLGHEVPRPLWVYTNLLRALHSIPVQALAVNGPALVSKMRFVTSTLLNEFSFQTPEVQLQENGRDRGPLDFLLGFLDIIGKIESHLPVSSVPEWER
ncbi:hypothetical protein C365_00930 [Cryptococcus neoformans Bt85]|nr:hypothetical protein C365_00930 [Cryptococcus neoformans var. grubii Bt85]